MLDHCSLAVLDALEIRQKRQFIAAKEKKADAELDVYKKTVLEEERVRQADERNRLSRQERNDLLGTVPGTTPGAMPPIQPR